MLVHELLNNPEFTFNPPVRIQKYDFDYDSVNVLWEESESSGDIPYDIYGMTISAINMGDDGKVEIECY